MIAGKVRPGATQNCSGRRRGDSFRSCHLAGRFDSSILLFFKEKTGAGRRAAVRRTHGRHASILLDFYCDQFIFSRSTRVLSVVLRLAVLAALTVEF